VRALLDTHAFLWWTLEDARLSDVARAVIEAEENEIFFSAASAWEIALKASRGGLTLPEPVETYIPDRIAAYGFTPLAIGLRHALRAGSLPPIHADPFDRILVAQSQAEDLPLLSADAAINRYDVETIW
jgi:PIN domain nuclease of toxin-antitoxin system